jgi:hypothetical protein
MCGGDHALRTLTLITLTIGLVPLAPGISLVSGDNLRVDFSDADGSITHVMIDDQPVPLLPGEPGGLSITVGEPVSPATLLTLDFDFPGGPWSSAQNADWDTTETWTTWIGSGGVGDTGYLILGNGAAQGVGMALADPLDLSHGGGTVEISWRARVASTETTQILCARIFDGGGMDITEASGAPMGWGWTSTSQAHGIWGLVCASPATWETFSQQYTLPPTAASLQISLRHWTGGDHLLEIDNLQVRLVGGIHWVASIPALGPVTPIPEGLRQTVDVPGQSLRIESEITAEERGLRVQFHIEDLTEPMTDRPMRVLWTLPIESGGATWWDDIAVSREIVAGPPLSHTFSLMGHPISLYPLSAVTGDDWGISLAVPMDEPTAQRFECAEDAGVRSLWEIGLSPLTANLGAGQASASLHIFAHDPEWGFRSAVERYQALFPEDFEKRTRREGAWEYPIPPNEIADPQDFGFAFFETWSVDAAERASCEAHDIGIFYYSEPWLAWHTWGEVPEKPSYEERVSLMEAWAASLGSVVTWHPDGGTGNSAHLILGDGLTTGVGMATESRFPVTGGETISIQWQARTASTETTQILCVRVFDSEGTDITQTMPGGGGWFWSSASQALVVVGLTTSVPDTWEAFNRTLTLPPEATEMRLSLRHWTGGDHLLHIDDLQVMATAPPQTLLSLDFESENGPWTAARNADWDFAGPTWLRVPRQQSAQAILACSPVDSEGNLLIDSHAYLWHAWQHNIWSQAWPHNSDPDLPSPNTFEIMREHWVLPELDQNDGIYIDSVTAHVPVGGWENHRPEHLVWADSPLTFSLVNGASVQLAPQPQSEFLAPIAAELRSQGKWMMLNLFHEAMRFQSRHADIMGSEVTELVESDTRSRVRRTLAGQRIVSNLLQWNWGGEFATHEQIEEFILGQLFWGFYPAISAAGGGTEEVPIYRYFGDPALYERDRDLFQRYVPIVRELSTAGWEVITGARVTAPGEIERFGDLSRGPVLFTVRGAAFGGQVTVNLAECGLQAHMSSPEVWDVMDSLQMSVTHLTDPPRLIFSPSLGEGEVSVYRLQVTVASGITLLGGD